MFQHAVALCDPEWPVAAGLAHLAAEAVRSKNLKEKQTGAVTGRTGKRPFSRFAKTLQSFAKLTYIRFHLKLRRVEKLEGKTQDLIFVGLLGKI